MQQPNSKQRNRMLSPVELVLESSIDSAELAEYRITGFAHRAGFDERQCHEIGLAIRESVANAVIHGNRSDAAKKVRVKAELKDNGLAVSIEDEGRGFEMDSVNDPLAPNHMLKDSGRGIFLVKVCMDDVKVQQSNSGGTLLTMLKYFPNVAKGEHE